MSPDLDNESLLNIMEMQVSFLLMLDKHIEIYVHGMLADAIHLGYFSGKRYMQYTGIVPDPVEIVVDVDSVGTARGSTTKVVSKQVRAAAKELGSEFDAECIMAEDIQGTVARYWIGIYSIVWNGIELFKLKAIAHQSYARYYSQWHKTWTSEVGHYTYEDYRIYSSVSADYGILWVADKSALLGECKLMMEMGHAKSVAVAMFRMCRLSKIPGNVKMSDVERWGKWMRDSGKCSSYLPEIGSSIEDMRGAISKNWADIAEAYEEAVGVSKENIRDLRGSFEMLPSSISAWK